jgi:hypothetical protein
MFLFRVESSSISSAGHVSDHLHCWEPVVTPEVETKAHPPSRFQKWECLANVFDQEELHESGATISHRKVYGQILFLEK